VTWNSSNLKLAHILVTVNTLTQLYYKVAKLPPMDRRSTSSVLTHRLQNFCRHRYLRFLHNGSVAFFRDQPATTAIKVLTGLGLGWQVLQAIGSLEGAWYMPLSLWQLVRKAMGGPFSACMLLELLAL
jgi:hypothetical protein